MQATSDAESPALPGHDADDSTDAESDLELFAPAHENQVGARDVLDMLPDPAAAAQVRAQIHDVIEAEGPIEVSRLARIVARRFGLSTVRTARADVIISLIPRARLRRHRLGTFAWPESLDPATWTDFRVAGDSVNRRLEEIAPEEIGNAMLALIDAIHDISEEELIRETGLLFGISRLSAQFRARLEAVLTMLQKEADITSPEEG